MPHKPTMSLSMPEYSPELEYSLDLGAEASAPTTPQLGGDAPPRARNWRPAGQEREQQARSTAYDADGNLKVAMRGRKAAERDCGICAETAVSPVRTQCCGALFCRAHIDDWIYAPASTGLCPACDAPCVLPPSRPRSPSPSSPSALTSDANANILDTRADSLRRPRTPPASRATSHSPSRPTGAGSVLVPSHDETDSSTGSTESALPKTPKYTRPGADALVRLLSVLAALVLLLGALSRRGSTDVAVVEGNAI
ncbi:hypothetical protein C8R47DRAFT_1313084 [Mycena vitilis]|nr:hypothetical protein C8R47DRAFT_1313084 [Mycena vitilis]